MTQELRKLVGEWIEGGSDEDDIRYEGFSAGVPQLGLSMKLHYFYWETAK